MLDSGARVFMNFYPMFLWCFVTTYLYNLWGEVSMSSDIGAPRPVSPLSLATIEVCQTLLCCNNMINLFRLTGIDFVLLPSPSNRLLCLQYCRFYHHSHLSWNLQFSFLLYFIFAILIIFFVSSFATPSLWSQNLHVTSLRRSVAFTSASARLLRRRHAGGKRLIAKLHS